MTAATLRPPSGDVLRKGTGYYAAGHVHLDFADPASGSVSALVTGSRPDPYHVTHGTAAGWRCGCQARVTCSHIVAVAGWLALSERAAQWQPVVAEAMGVAPTGQPTEPEEEK